MRPGRRRWGNKGEVWEGFQLEQGGPKTGEWTVRRGEAESCLILAGSGGCTAGCGGQVVPWGVLVCTVGTANRSTLWPQRLEGGAPWADVDAAAGTGCGHGEFRPPARHSFVRSFGIADVACCLLPPSVQGAAQGKGESPERYKDDDVQRALQKEKVEQDGGEETVTGAEWPSGSPATA